MLSALVSRLRLSCLALFAAPLLALGAQAEPALWKVQGPHATVWLFGTIHLLKPDTAWRDSAVDQALKASQALYLEVPNIDDQANNRAVVLKYGVDPKHPLSTRLDPLQRAALIKVLADYNVPEAQLEPLRPWLAATVVESLPLLKAGFDPKQGVEMSLMAEARAAGKPVKGFETTEEQARYLADLPKPEETAFLMSAIDDANQGLGEIDKLTSAWQAGDLKTIDDLVNQDVARASPSLYKILIVDRNARFASAIADLAKGSGTTFVALGAGHFAGDDSIQADLAKLGLVATRQ